MWYQKHITAPHSQSSSLISSRYAPRFEAEALELPVLIQLARSDGKEALDEALKEMGVRSVGHRLAILRARADLGVGHTPQKR